MSEYYAIQRSTDHLAHYGVKGMKWGVRRALARGNSRALDRHFRKAAKKLTKLQDIGLYSKKYATKAAAYGAAAVGTGVLAAKRRTDLTTMLKPSKFKAPSVQLAFEGPNASRPVVYKTVTAPWFKGRPSPGKISTKPFIQNKTFRIGTGVAAAGLAGMAGLNAYRASHGAKYRKKAVEFKDAMDREFAGTKYAGKYIPLPKQKKKKRR